MNTISETRTKRIAFLTAAACVLQVVESFFPHPFPGVRLGLANIIALLALFDLGFGVALQIAVLRTIVASLFIGTFLSPTFILSFSGAILSISLLGMMHKMTTARGRAIFSIVGFSILGAVTHNLTQLSIIYFFSGRNSGTFLFMPWLVLTGVGTGLLTGIIAAKALRMISSAPQPLAGKLETSSGRSRKADTAESAMAAGKLTLTVLFIATIVVAPRPEIILPISLVMILGLYPICRVQFKTLAIALRRGFFLILFTFVITAVFSDGALATRFVAGAILSGRIAAILLCTTLVTSTTENIALAGGIAQLLKPLRLLGLSSEHIATTIAATLDSIPCFWKIFQDYRSNARRPSRKFREIIPWLASLLAHVYQQAVFVEQKGTD